MSGRIQFDPWLTPNAKTYIQKRLLHIRQGSPGLYNFALKDCPGILSVAEDQSRRAIQLFVDKYHRKYPDRPQIISKYGFMSALNYRFRDKEKKKRRIAKWLGGVAQRVLYLKGRQWLDSEALQWLADELNFVYPVLLVRMMIDTPRLVEAIFNLDKEWVQYFIDERKAVPMAAPITSRQTLLNVIVITYAKKLNVRDYPYTIAHMFIECLVNGHKTRGLIDTGGMTSMIPAKLAYSCGLPAYQLDTKQAQRTYGIEGEYNMLGKFHNVPLEIGTFVTVIDLDVVKTSTPYVLLGMNFLRKHQCRVSCRIEAVIFPVPDKDQHVYHPARERVVVCQVATQDTGQQKDKSEKPRRASVSDDWMNTFRRLSENTRALPQRRSSWTRDTREGQPDGELGPERGFVPSVALKWHH